MVAGGTVISTFESNVNDRIAGSTAGALPRVKLVITTEDTIGSTLKKRY